MGFASATCWELVRADSSARTLCPRGNMAPAVPARIVCDVIPARPHAQFTPTRPVVDLPAPTKAPGLSSAGISGGGGGSAPREGGLPHGELPPSLPISLSLLYSTLLSLPPSLPRSLPRSLAPSPPLVRRAFWVAPSAAAARSRCPSPPLAAAQPGMARAHACPPAHARTGPPRRGAEAARRIRSGERGLSGRSPEARHGAAWRSPEQRIRRARASCRGAGDARGTRGGRAGDVRGTCASSGGAGHAPLRPPRTESG